MAKTTTQICLPLQPGQHDDLIAWYESLTPEERDRAVAQAIRRGLDGRATNATAALDVFATERAMRRLFDIQQYVSEAVELLHVLERRSRPRKRGQSARRMRARRRA